MNVTNYTLIHHQEAKVRVGFKEQFMYTHMTTRNVKKRRQTKT